MIEVLSKISSILYFIIKYSKTCINRPPLGPKNMAGMDSWPVYSDMQMTESQGRSMKRGVGKV